MFAQLGCKTAAKLAPKPLSTENTTMKKLYGSLKKQNLNKTPLKRNRTFPLRIRSPSFSDIGTLRENVAGFLRNLSGHQQAEIEGAINYTLPETARSSCSSINSVERRAHSSFFDPQKSEDNSSRLRALDKPFSRLNKYFRPSKPNISRIKPSWSSLMPEPPKVQWVDPDSIPKSFLLEVREALERKRDNNQSVNCQN